MRGSVVLSDSADTLARSPRGVFVVFGEPVIFTTEARRTQREVLFRLPGDGGRQNGALPISAQSSFG